MGATLAGTAHALNGGNAWQVQNTANSVMNLGTLVGALTITGHGREREMDADAAAMIFLAENDLGTEHLANALKKMSDVSPDRRHGPFSSHPETDERIRLLDTGVVIPMTTGYEGRTRDGALAATVDLVAQVIRGHETWIYANITATNAIGRRDNINNLDFYRSHGRRRIKTTFKEMTAERIEPGGTVSAVFASVGAGRIDESSDMTLKIRNASRWSNGRPVVNPSRRAILLGRAPVPQRGRESTMQYIITTAPR